jgi:peptide methionine sulfoxide reductase MsrA
VSDVVVPAAPGLWIALHHSELVADGAHQQYLDANPNGYCPVHATGVKCG